MIGISICVACKHFISIKKSEKGHSYCPAFPNGIPDNIMHRGTHDKVVSGQVGEYVFDCKEDFPLYERWKNGKW